MPLSPSARARLDRWFNGYSFSGQDRDLHRAVDIFVDLYVAGERPSETSIRQWALGHGWSEADAETCSQLYGLVIHALRRAGAVPLRP